MKKTFSLMLLSLLFVISSCSATNGSFTIKKGTQSEQLGLETGQGDVPYYGPVAIAVNDNEIAILDEVNLKINIYTYEGQYKKSINIPKGPLYCDIAISLKGKILLLTNTKIYLVSQDGKMKELYKLPEIVRIPYYFSIDQSERIVLSCLTKQGRILTGIMNPGGIFKELKGSRIFVNYSGIIGIQTSKNSFELIKEGKVLDKITINPDAIPIGLTENMNLFLMERTKTGTKLSRVNKNGILNEKEISFKSVLLFDDSSSIKFFRANRKGQIIYLESNDNDFKVTITSLE